MRRVIGNRLAEVAVWNLIGRMVCKNVPSFFQSFFPYGFLGVADYDEELDDSPAFSYKTWSPEKLDIISLIPINFTIRLWNSEPTKGRSVWLANSLCFLRQSIVAWLILPLNVHLARADAGALDALFVFLLLLLWLSLWWLFWLLSLYGTLASRILILCVPVPALWKLKALTLAIRASSKDACRTNGKSLTLSICNVTSNFNAV